MTFPAFMTFYPAPAFVSIKNLIPNLLPLILFPNPIAGGETAPVTKGRRGFWGGREGKRGRRHKKRGGNSSTLADSSRNFPIAPSNILPVADCSPSANNSHENSDPDD